MVVGACLENERDSLSEDETSNRTAATEQPQIAVATTKSTAHIQFVLYADLRRKRKVPGMPT